MRFKNFISLLLLLLILGGCKPDKTATKPTTSIPTASNPAPPSHRSGPTGAAPTESFEEDVMAEQELNASARLLRGMEETLNSIMSARGLKRANVAGSPYNRAENLGVWEEERSIHSFSECDEDEYRDLRNFPGEDQKRTYVACFLKPAELGSDITLRYLMVVPEVETDTGSLLNDSLMFLKTSVLEGATTFTIQDDSLLVNRQGQGMWLLRMTTESRSYGYLVWVQSDGTVQGYEVSTPVGLPEDLPF